ncbi:N-acetylglucosamine-6-phosphate deacetylase [hydrothermal vent metagenome]|uniref:N-acetylglucosamine-6-phosphate deacetylase n=1 Tax=hydrothermal vent metagenome TaxID=652676 RepID=A0A1W1C277_9ZZZZ
MKAIINATIIDNKRVLRGYSLVFDDKIVSLTQDDIPKECEVIDGSGHYVSAGFVDIHIHGSGGADVMDATPQALDAISMALLDGGTTTFIATTMTMSQEKIVKALDNIVEYGGSVGGAKIGGIHLEGPFINPSKCGAQDPFYIQEPNFEWIEPYLPYVKMITIAPEVDGAREFIERVHKESSHVVLSVGHSSANYKEAKDSFKWGVSHATHLFNAMPPLHHREPALLGAIFDSDITVDIIADLVHTDGAILSMVEKLKRDKVILITDAMRAGCMQSGEYELGGQRVVVTDGRATLESGLLAGSVLRLNQAVHNFHNHSEASLAECIYMVTRLPSDRLGLNVGRLENGYSADIVMFDSDINIVKTFIDGEIKDKKFR